MEKNFQSLLLLLSFRLSERSRATLFSQYVGSLGRDSISLETDTSIAVFR